MVTASEFTKTSAGLAGESLVSAYWGRKQVKDVVWGQSLDGKGGEVDVDVFMEGFIRRVEGGRAACQACIGLDCVLVV